MRASARTNCKVKILTVLSIYLKSQIFNSHEFILKTGSNHTFFQSEI